MEMYFISFSDKCSVLNDNKPTKQTNNIIRSTYYTACAFHYLSDMLRTLTGQNTQQHIQNKVIEKAKELMSTGNLSVAEIAYSLGFVLSNPM